MATAPLCDPGWTNNLSSVPDISMSDVASIIQQHSKVAGKHIDKGYNFFHGSYVHSVEGKFSVNFLSLRQEKKVAFSLNL